MIVIVNESSFGGQAKKKWKKIAPLIHTRFPNSVIRKTPDLHTLDQYMEESLQEDVPIVIAGGDGTIHWYLQKWINAQSNARLGMIGVGSSNSFMRSLPHETYRGVKLSIDHDEIDWDLGRAEFNNQKRYFMANVSIGFLALGNELFNKNGGFTRLLKSISTELANFWVFLKAMIYYRPLEVSVSIDDGEFQPMRILNFQILKARYYTGGYHFPENAPNGKFEIRISHWVSRWHTLKTFFHLSFNSFQRLTHHEHLAAEKVEIQSRNDVAIELDGELVQAREVRFKSGLRTLQLGGFPRGEARESS